MIYIARRPGLALQECVRLLWYCKAPALPHARERILPRGEMQIILNLAADTLSGYSCETGETAHPLASSIVVGPRAHFELIDTTDLTELLGIAFWPGGAAPFFHENASLFFERFIPLEDVSPCRDLRTRLQEQKLPVQKLRALEEWLVSRLSGRALRRNPVAVPALHLLERHSVRDAARLLCLSERRLHQVLKTEVGLSPKLWSRLQRFQQTVRRLHAGEDLRWEQLALDCGFYDQSHFCNEFKAFSGVDPSTYAAAPRIWSNHVPEEKSH